MKKTIAIFASYNGSIIDTLYLHAKSNDFIISLIITNNTNANVLNKGSKYDIPSYVINDKLFKKPDEEIQKLLQKYSCNLIVLAGYMKKISPHLINNYTIINSHPALLPKYGGQGMYGKYVHQAVINNKEHESGVTIHYVNEEYDEGKIILQKKLPIIENETSEGLESKIKELEKQAYLEALNIV